ncbi:MAG: tetratricopeptide repeat protein [Pirellulales bacterium]|nr:tetratricopeptide repeat protein [Pirellulales bacterium]
MNRKGRSSKRALQPPARASQSTSAPFDAGWRPLWSLALLVIAIMLVYGQTLGHRFSTWDDPINVAENPYLNPVTWESVQRFWREPYALLYVPVTYTFWSAEAWLAETPATPQTPRYLAAGVFHAGNLLLHVLSVLSMWQILRLLVRTELPAFFGALFYALHPLLAESVAWVTETKGLLAGALGWFAVWQHLVAIDAGSETGNTAFVPRRDGVRILRHTIAALAFGLALLAKPSAVSLPAMAVVLDVVFLRSTLRKSLLTLAPWFGLALLSVAATWWQQSGDELHFVPPPLWQRPFIAGDSLAFYLWKTIWPLNLGIDHGRSPSAIFASGAGYFAWLVPVVLAAAIYATRERRAWWGALAIFVLGLLPVSGLVPFSFQDISTVADRYAYLAMLGPALAISWFLVAHRQAAWYGAFAVLLLLAAGRSAWQASRWRDDQTLFAHSIRVNPTSYISHTLLGRTLLWQAVPDLNGARANYLAAVEIAPERPRAYCDLGYLERKLGHHAEALAQYEHAAQLDPNLAEAHLGIGLALATLGRHHEALTAYQRTIELEPEFGVGWYNYALALHDTGEQAKAIEMLRRALVYEPQLRAAQIELIRLLILAGRDDEVIAEFERELSRTPNDATVHDRYAVALMELGRLEAALEQADRAIELAPLDLTPRRHRAHVLLRQKNFTEAYEQFRWIDARQPGSPAALDLAWSLATQPDAEWRDGAEALRLATSYCETTRYADPRGVDVLAAAYAESGDFQRATALAKRALEAAQEGGHHELAREIEPRLALYQQQRPFRLPSER